MSSIDWNCCGIIFFGGKKKVQKFWMQSDKEDKQVISLEKMVCAWMDSALCVADSAEHRS